MTGPRILSAGYALYPFEGVPFYLRDVMSPAEVTRLRTPATAADAVRDVKQNFDAGADALKLFVVSWMGRGTTKPMDEHVALAAAATAHERGKLVFAHPSTVRGLEIAIAAHVDVLAHADLVLLGADPRNSVLAFTQVKTTFRGGRVIYDGPFPR